MEQNIKDDSLLGIILLIVFILLLQSCSVAYTTDDVYYELDDMSDKIDDVYYELDDMSDKIDDIYDKVGATSYTSYGNDLSSKIDDIERKVDYTYK